jgi:hypothetical protein
MYPKYPEVRFSGFLIRCKDAPSDLMTGRIEKRLLFFGINNEGKILGYVAAPDSQIANEFNSMPDLETVGVFSVLTIQNRNIQRDTRYQLLEELKRIHNKGWIKSKKLGPGNEIRPCEAPNCGGYTLEAEFGITPNGYAEPDYLGWEIKQFAVKSFSKYLSSIVTLMTPEPTGGYYVDHGLESFVRKFGYIDKMGRADRMNFGGVHKAGIPHPTTNLTLTLQGFDSEKGMITDISGCIALLGSKDIDAASWSFASLLKHWNRKHAKATYIPSITTMDPERRYFYGNNIMLGTGTDFTFFLKQMSLGHIYYDPGIKLEHISTKPTNKRRSQFRIKSLHIPNLYRSNEIVDLETI